MPGGILSGVNSGYVSQDVLNVLKQGDIRVGTLETAIGNEPYFYEEKMKRKADVIYAKDCDLQKLVDLGINIVSLANNHFFDLGPEGAIHTIELLDQLGIEHIGAGRNLEEASRPVVKWFDGISVAFLAFCDWREETVGWCPFATENSPGVNPMYDDYVVEEIRKYKKMYDYVVVMPHWGREHSFYPTSNTYKMSEVIRKAGADLILGSHPHRVQPVVNYKKGAVAFSMGNFFFPERLLNYPRSTWYPQEKIDYSLLPETYGYPRIVNGPTLKHWTYLAKVGMIVLCNIEPGGRIRMKYTLCGLVEKLSIHRDGRLKMRLSLLSAMIKLKVYAFGLFLHSKVR